MPESPRRAIPSGGTREVRERTGGDRARLPPPPESGEWDVSSAARIGEAEDEEGR